MTVTQRRKLFKLYLLTAFMVLGIFGALEFGVRHYASASEITEIDSKMLMSDMSKMHIAGREVGNQMLVHNVALFSHYPVPSSIATGYVGTSRSKVLRPQHFGVPAAVVGAGNSYSEITYGLLLQAEILRLRFPKLKRVYFETSMLLRRPARLIVEEDHRKYLPLLRTLQPLCMQLPASTGCRLVFNELNTVAGQPEPKTHSELLKKRSELRVVSLIAEKKQEGMSVMDDPLLAGLQTNGERKSLPRAGIPKEHQPADITNDHVKVQRLRDVRSYGSGDGLFDLIALWGRMHNIEIVFFQPPVRSDLYRYKVEYGLTQHVADIERISRTYGVTFIDLNRPELGYMNDWSLFSDEDHLETCIGSGLLTLALEEGYMQYRIRHELFPKIERRELQARQAKRLKVCEGL